MTRSYVIISGKISGTVEDTTPKNAVKTFLRQCHQDGSCNSLGSILKVKNNSRVGNRVFYFDVKEFFQTELPNLNFERKPSIRVVC